MWKCNVDSSLSWPCFRCSDILHSAMSPQGGSGVTITAYTTQSHSFTVCYCHRVQIRPLDFHRRYVRLYNVPYYKENQCHTCFKCVPTVVDIKEKIEVMIRYVWCKRAFAGKCRPTVSIPSDPRTWVASGHLKGTPGDPLSITGEQAGMVPLYCQMFWNYFFYLKIIIKITFEFHLCWTMVVPCKTVKTHMEFKTSAWPVVGAHSKMRLIR